MIQIYVQELSTYNSAIGVGEWMNVSDFDTKLPELMKRATEVLIENGYYNGYEAEEYEILDWECDVDINLDSIYGDIKTLKELNELLKESNEDEIKKISFLMAEGCSVKDLKDAIDEVYYYPDWDEACDEFIELYLQINVDEKVYPYIDFQKVQRDLEYSGEFSEYNGEVYARFN